MFLPGVFGCEISNAEQQLFTIPARMDSLGVGDVTELCDFSYATSRKGCDLMVQAITGLEKFEVETHMGLLSDVKAEAVKIKGTKFNAIFESLLGMFGQSHQQPIRHARDGKM